MLVKTDLFNQCINSLESDLIESRRELKDLQWEIEVYERVIMELKSIIDNGG